MITTESSRRRPIFVYAIAVSLLIHLALGAAWLGAQSTLAEKLAALMPRPFPTPTELVELSDAIKIEHRTVRQPQPPPKPPQPKPAPRQVAVQPQPKPIPPVPVAKPLPPKPKVEQAPPKPRTIRQEIAKNVPTAAPLPAKVEATGAPRKTPAQVAYRPDESSKDLESGSPSQVTRPTKPRLTQAQLAALQSQFAQTIAQQRAAAQAMNSIPTSEPQTMKRYAMQFQGRIGDLKEGEGILTPVKSWYDGPYVYYYLKYEYVYADGTFETGYVPWPVRYPRNQDPFMQPPHPMPLPGPLPGWSLQAGQELPKYLHRYFPDRFPGETFPD